jgi:hypothetical protein
MLGLLHARGNMAAVVCTGTIPPLTSLVQHIGQRGNMGAGSSFGTSSDRCPICAYVTIEHKLGIGSFMLAVVSSAHQHVRHASNKQPFLRLPITLS